MSRALPIHQSLHRHAHVLGAEREPVMTSALIALLVGGLTAVSVIAAAAFWLVAVFALRRMAKADPMMSRVWLRHIKQQDYYPAKASLWRPLGGYSC
ncbi:MAG: VirB3 family type IV secretion system protein [Desulfovibrio sp.]|jgi:type IV secretion system protein VirB3/type IV secretion system protein VirB4|nr:VirB3 family type IV secretion system protein [Desulfovibrio sp.]